MLVLHQQNPYKRYLAMLKRKIMSKEEDKKLQVI